MNNDRAPMRKVTVNHGWQSHPTFKRGLLNGTAVWWDLELECGHRVSKKSANGSVTKSPKSAGCEECRRAAQTAAREKTK